MSTSHPVSRRSFIQIGLGVAGAALIGCKSAAKDVVCTDTAGLAQGDVMLRQALAYADISAKPDKNCANCVQYVPPSAEGCGTCKLVKGPINPKGYCNSWAAKT